MYGTQLTIMVLQLAYTSVTSRAVAPSGFGAFAIALSAASIAGLLANAGLASAIARRTGEDLSGDRALVTLSVMSGAAFATVVALTAPWWAQLWGDPSAVVTTRMIALATLMTPVAGTVAGILRRQGRIRLFATGTFAASIIAMLVGAITVSATKEPWALTLMPVLVPTLSLLLWLPFVGRRAWPSRHLRGAGNDMRFGLKSLSASLVFYFTSTLATLTLSRTLGPSTLGSWNRATAVGQVPMESFSRAALTVIYPSFRHHQHGTDSSRMAWTSMLSAACLVTLPAAALAIPVLPYLTQILLGPQWLLVGEMARWLMASTAVFVLATLLAGALESSNNFAGVWLPLAALVVTLGGSTAALYFTRQWLALGIGMTIAAFAFHIVQIVYASREGLLNARRLLGWYAAVAAGSLLLMAIVILVNTAFGNPVAALVALFLAWTYALVLFLFRHRVEGLLEIS